MQNEPMYSVFDTAQLINLLRDNRMLILNSQEFIDKSGSPILFYEHLLELSKIGNFEKFSKDICVLESVDTFKSIRTYDGAPYPAFMLLEREIYLYSKFGKINIEILRNDIFGNIIDYKLDVTRNNDMFLYNKLHSEVMKDALSSVLPSAIRNPNFRKKLSTLEKNNVILYPATNSFLCDSITNFMQNRLKNKSEIDNFLPLFKSFQDDKKRDAKSALDLAKENFGQNIDLNQTYEDLFYNQLFEGFKDLAIRHYEIKTDALKEVRYDNLILNKIFFYCLKYYANEYNRDKCRKIESSDIHDIYFLCCSVIFKVFVDKRTFPLGKQISKELGIKLNIEKNI